MSCQAGRISLACGPAHTHSGKRTHSCIVYTPSGSGGLSPASTSPPSTAPARRLCRRVRRRHILVTPQRSGCRMAGGGAQGPGGPMRRLEACDSDQRRSPHGSCDVETRSNPNAWGCVCAHADADPCAVALHPRLDSRAARSSTAAPVPAKCPPAPCCTPHSPVVGCPASVQALGLQHGVRRCGRLAASAWLWP